MTTVADLENVSFAYGDQPAVEDVSLSIEAGEFLGLVGPNGSGKTTLLRLMLGLLTPDQGTVRLFDTPIETFDDGHRIGYVAQRATTREETMPVTVREVVAMGRYARAGFGRLTETDHEHIDAALETVGIEGLADRRIGALSGGQQQRTYIARALASEADLLALDEPTVGVDASSREAFYELLERLNADGITIVLIEHDIGVITGHVTQVACINRQLYHHGDTESFIESNALEAAYGAESRVLHHHHHDE